VSAYSLTATHSIAHDRSKDRHNGIIQIKCTLTVHLLTLQPIVDRLLRSPLSRRRPCAISIHNISHYRDRYDGTQTWTFIVRLRTCKKKARTRTWWGRSLSASELQELPLALLGRLERMLNNAWYNATRDSRAQPKRPYGVLKMLT
jgi:hypothetical protein